MRTYYRASGGVDGAIQTLLFWAVILTAPIWVPVIGLIVLYEALFPKKYEQIPVPKPAIVRTYTAAPAYVPLPRPVASAPVASAPVKRASVKPIEPIESALCRAYRKLEEKGIADVARGYPGMGSYNIKEARAKLIEHNCN